MGLIYSSKHQYLHESYSSYMLHDCLANLNSSSTILIALILFIIFFEKWGVTYFTRCSTQTPQPANGQMLQKACWMLYFKINIIYKVPPGGSKPFVDLA